jgi:hypothetical protein
MSEVNENNDQEINAERIAKHYSAMLDSVSLITSGKPSEMEDEVWDDILSRNIEHLNIMLEKDFWTSEDMAPVTNAIAVAS